MSLTIFSFKRAFSSKNQMALAAGNIDNIEAALKAKDILDSLHLGLICETMACDEFCNSTRTIDEFIDNCPTLLGALSKTNENGIVTVNLVNQDKLILTEKNNTITLKMGKEQTDITGTSLSLVYQNLVNDIQDNPDIYGISLADSVKNQETTALN